MGKIIDALAPIGDYTGFPLPTLVQSSGPGQPSVTYEGPTINGIPMPGQWLLTSAKRQYGWQEQVSNFQSGGTVVPKGDPPMHVEYEVRIWEDGTMAAFIVLCGTLFKKPVVSLGGGVPVSAALGLHDPVLKVLGVTNVVVDFVDFPKNPLVSSGGKGPWIGKMGFIEYRRPVPALAVPDQTIPDPGAVTPAAANNLAVAQAALTAGAAKLQSTLATAHVPPH